MKKLIPLFVLFALFPFFSSAQEETDFYGKWQFQDIENKDLSDSAGIVMLEKIMKTLSFYFKEDKTYRSEFIGAIDNGTWEYNKKLNKLIVYSNKGEIQPFEVLVANKELLKLKDRKKRITLFMPTPLTAKDTALVEIDPINTVSTTKAQLCKLWFLKKKENPEYSNEQQKLASSITKGFIYRFDEDGTVFSKAFSVENETQWEFGANNESIIIKGESFDVVWNIIAIDNNSLTLKKVDAKDLWIFSTEQ